MNHLNYLPERFSFASVSRSQGKASNHSSYGYEQMTLKPIVGLLFRGTVAVVCFASETATLGCTTELTQRNRNAIDQMDVILVGVKVAKLPSAATKVVKTLPYKAFSDYF